MIRALWCMCTLLLALGCAPAQSRAPLAPTPGSAPRRPAPAARPAAATPTAAPYATAPDTSQAEAPNATLTGTVARVVDGDTLRVDLPTGQERIRLIGMDTPETKHPDRGIEPFGPEATAAAERLCPPGTQVRLELDVETRDQYGRLLAYVYLPDERMLNAEMLREGLARIYTFPPNVRHAQDFLQIERQARAAGRGMWGQDAPNADANAAGPTP